MRASRPLVVFALALAIAPIAAARQLAILVEVAPRGAVDGGTLAEITVRIAPEDRAALTEDVMLWVELSRDGARVFRRGWALKIDDPDEPIAVEIVIPDGPHVLRVDLKGAGSGSTGLWWGDVDVSAPVPEPVPVPVPVPDDSGQRQQPAAVTAAAAAAAPVSAPAPVPKSVPEPVPVPVPAPVPVPPAAQPDRGAPVLALAVDLHEQSSADLAWIGAMVRRLVERTERGPKDVLVTDIDGGFHRSGSGDVASMMMPARSETGKELPELVRSSLEGLRSTSGATALLVVTDGRGPRTGRAWSDAHRAASKAGVPILVAGIWNDDFGSGLRRDLRKLAAASGGAVFYVQGPGQTDNLVDRFGVILEDCSTAGVDADVHASTADRRAVGPADPPTVETRRGRFTYMADAALFEDCGSGLRFPVAMEADYLAAERAYLETRTEPGSAVLMTIEGRLESRPPMEGDGLIEMIVIDRFIAAHPGESCE